MPFNGSGTYAAPPLPASFNPAAVGGSATPAEWNTLLADLSTALSTCVTKDGQTTITADIPMATHKITGLGDPTVAQDAATKNYVDTSVAVTGLILPYVGITAPTGWVICNGLTIGNAASGGTLRADADTVNLFTLLWNSWADAEAAVSGGRGANAAADYAANKTIAVPDLRGRLIAGMDIMGGSATASRLSGIIASTTPGVAGGDQNMQQHSHNISLSNAGVGGSGGGALVLVGGSSTTTNTGAGGSQNVQPTMVMNLIIKL